MEFTQFVITYYKEWAPVDIDMLLNIMESFLSKSDSILLSSGELSCFSIFSLVYNLDTVNWEGK